jgi:cell division protein FtsX
MFDIGYNNYLVALLIITGYLVLRFDVKIYEMANMKKERRVAKFIGRTNIFIGILFFITDWVYQIRFW